MTSTRTNPPAAGRWWILIALSMLAALLPVALFASPAEAQNGLGFGGGNGRPGAPAAVNIAALNNTPLANQWGVSGMDPNRTTNYEVQVWDIAVIGNRYYVAGSFLYVQQGRNTQRYNQPYLAAFNIDTGAWDDNFRPQLNGSAYALEVSPRGKLLVGGEFTSVAGRANTEGLTSLNPGDGSYDTGWAGSVQRPWTSDPAVVRSLEVIGNNLYVAGNFTHVRGNSDAQRTRVYKVARMNASWGTPDSTFKPQVEGAGVWGFGIDTVNNRMHLTGFFSSVAGQPNTNNYATVSLVDGALIPGQGGYRFNDPRRTEMHDVEVAAGKVWVGGSQHNVQVLDASSRNLLGYHTTSFAGCNGDALAWCSQWAGGGDYQVVEEVGNYIMAGCHCVVETNTVGTPNHYSSFDGRRFRSLLLEAYDKNTGRFVSSFVPDLAGSEDGVWAVHADGRGCLLVGGQFTVGGLKTGSSFWVGNIARFCPDGINPGPDTQSPTTPTGLTATANGNTVNLNWNNSTDNRGVDSYNVYRDGGWVGWSRTSDWTDPNPPVGSVRYQVRAYDAAGNRSGLSAWATVNVGGNDTTPPSAVTGLTSSVSGSTVSLNWNDSSDPSGIDGYNVFRNGAWLAWATSSNYTDSNRPNGTYTYTVRAYDRVGNRTAQSSPTTATVGGGDAGFSCSVSNNVVSWTNLGANGYDLAQDGGAAIWVTATSYRDFTPGTNYRVTAWGNGQSGKTTTCTNPGGGGGGFSCSVNNNADGSKTITWTDIGANGYDLSQDGGAAIWITNTRYVDQSPGNSYRITSWGNGTNGNSTTC